MMSIRSFLRGWLIAAALIAPMHAIHAAELAPAAILAALASDDNTARNEAIGQLGLLASSGGADILAALAGGQLLLTADGTLLVRRDTEAVNCSTGDTVSVPADAQPISLNNRLRRALQAAQASSELFSTNVATRFTAAQRLQKEGDPARAPAIKRALESEQDPEVRQALNVALAASSVKSTDADERLRAVALMGDSQNPAFRPVLSAMLVQGANGAPAEPDARVRAAATKAISQIDKHQTIVSWVGNLFYGVSLGSVLLLAALGLAITFGLMGVINMAHGELLMIGAYSTYVVQLLFSGIHSDRAGRHGARAHGHSLALWSSAGNAAGHLGHQSVPDAGRAQHFRRAERRGREPVLAHGRCHGAGQSGAHV